MRSNRQIYLWAGIVLVFAMAAGDLFGQIILLNRGRLWEGFNVQCYGGKWGGFQMARPAMQWPGYMPQWTTAMAGTQLTNYHTGGGINFSSGRADSTHKRMDHVQWWRNEDPTGGDPEDSKYFFLRHEQRFPDGSNYFLQTDPTTAEEVIDTAFEFNLLYQSERSEWLEYWLPCRWERTIMSWGSYAKDQDYYLTKYKITNIDTTFGTGITLQDFYAMWTYSIGTSMRGAALVGMEAGSPDDWVMLDDARKLMYAYDGDFPENAYDDTYDYLEIGGVFNTGEYASPGHFGLLLLGGTANRRGDPKPFQGFKWTSSQRDLWQVPTHNLADDDLWHSMRDLDMLYSPMGPGDQGTKFSFGNMSLGPWDMAPGESIEFTMAHIMAGVDASLYMNPNTPKSTIATGLDSLKSLADYIQNVNYANNFNIPDVPAGPDSFSVGPSQIAGVLGNILRWTDVNESIPDPDYTGEEAYDLAGYNVWKSEYSFAGPFEIVGKVTKGNLNYYNDTTGVYTYIDTDAKVGFSYIYAVTAYDTGHDTWPVDPDGWEAYNGSRSVPSLETSRYNTKIDYFTTILPPSASVQEVVVVPNPFVQESGYTIPRTKDNISFVHIPGYCTIRIYSLNGRLIKKIKHETGFGIATWDQISSSEQFSESGTYIYHITSDDPATRGETTVGKFVIIR